MDKGTEERSVAFAEEMAQAVFSRDGDGEQGSAIPDHIWLHCAPHGRRTAGFG